MSQRKKKIIGCRIFADELSAVLPEEYKDMDISWLDPGLHCNLDMMEAELKQALGEAEAENLDVRVLFGKSCHLDMCRIFNASNHNVLDAKNCIDALIPGGVEELEKHSTVVMTPAWVRFFPNIMAVAGWDETDIRINWGRYDRILLLDPGINSLTDEEILDFYDLIQVPIEVQEINLDHFRKKIMEILE